MMDESRPLRVAIVQRLCPHYRIPFYRALNNRKGIDLTLLVSDSKLGQQDEDDLGFKLINVPALSINLTWGVKRYYIPFNPFLIRYLWRGRYDIVVTEGATNVVNNLFLYPACRLLNVRFVWWGAGRRRQASRNLLRRITDPFIKELIRRADACIAYGTVARDYMIDTGAQQERVFVAPNTLDVESILEGDGVNIEQIIKKKRALGLENHKIVLYVGVIERRKKVENLILAFDKLRQKSDLPITLLVIGDGPHLKTLQVWCRASGLDTDIHFLGRIVDQVGLYFSMCDVFVLPSEGGLALNQAMAYGKPVIATSADGTEVDLIQNGENGFIVAEDDINALSEAVARMINADESEWGGMASRSVDLIRNSFTLSNMVEGFLEALHLCAKGL